MKTLDLERWKKLRLQLSLTVRNDFATEFHSSTHQNLRFNNFKLFLKAIAVTWNVTANELRSLSFFWKIPLQTFRIQSCMYRSEKEEWKVVCNDCIPLCPHSATYLNLKQKLLLTICICASTAKFSIKKYSKWNSI